MENPPFRPVAADEWGAVLSYREELATGSLSQLPSKFPGTWQGLVAVLGYSTTLRVYYGPT